MIDVFLLRLQRKKMKGKSSTLSKPTKIPTCQLLNRVCSVSCARRCCCNQRKFRELKRERNWEIMLLLFHWCWCPKCRCKSLALRSELQIWPSWAVPTCGLQQEIYHLGWELLFPQTRRQSKKSGVLLVAGEKLESKLLLTGLPWGHKLI